MTTKICKTCGLEKNINEFLLRTDTNTYRGSCKLCYNEKVKIYKDNNKDKISEYWNNYYAENKNEINQYRKEYYHLNREHELSRNKKYNDNNKEKLDVYYAEYRENHREEAKAYDVQYRKENKEKIRIRKNNYSKTKKKNDPVFNLRSRLSTAIWIGISSNGFSKNKKSITKFLPYKIKDLKEHLEKQFESWMTWQNYGRYSSQTWNDNDSSTWTWQIDHIIPQSDLPYTSMNDDNFKKCWALENLRPLSSKRNLIEGVTKIRHGK